MSREEYEKLVKSSLSFKEMSPDLQSVILTAEGDEMERYIRVFTEENQIMAAAIKSFDQSNEEAINMVKTVLNKERINNLSQQEKQIQIVEEEKLTGLLNKI